jgi:hypothetical protein
MLRVTRTRPFVGTVPAWTLVFAALLVSAPSGGSMTSGRVPGWVRDGDFSPAGPTLMRVARAARGFEAVVLAEARRRGSGVAEAGELAEQLMDSTRWFDGKRPARCAGWESTLTVEVGRGRWSELAGVEARWCRLTPTRDGARVLHVRVAIPGSLTDLKPSVGRILDRAKLAKRLSPLPGPVRKVCLDAHELVSGHPGLAPYVAVERTELDADTHSAFVRVLERLAAGGGERDREPRTRSFSFAGTWVAASLMPGGLVSPDDFESRLCAEALSSDTVRERAVNRLLDAALEEVPRRPCHPLEDERDWLQRRVLGASEPAELEPARDELADALGIER